MEKLTTRSSGSLKKNIRLNGPGLELYHSYNSFYSQKVVFTLNEKKLPYESKIVDIYKFEQYEPWYLKLNPIGEVPVLKDDIKVIPDTTRIIDYLEDNFNNGDVQRLTPEKGTEQWVKMKYFREQIDDVKMELLMFGSLWHPEQTIKSALNEAQRKKRLLFLESLPAKLDELIVMEPGFSESLIKKKEKILQILKMRDLGQFEKLLIELDNNLDSVETELANHIEEKTEWWLCSENFTLVDISLTMLLGQLKLLGLFERFTMNRTWLRKYFERAQIRDSYKNALRQGGITVLDKVQHKHMLSYAIGSFLILGLIVTATILYKRLK